MKPDMKMSTIQQIEEHFEMDLGEMRESYLEFMAKSDKKYNWVNKLEIFTDFANETGLDLYYIDRAMTLPSFMIELADYLRRYQLSQKNQTI